MRLQGVGWKPYGLPCACMDALEARRKNKRRSLQWITIAGTVAHGRFLCGIWLGVLWATMCPYGFP